MRECIYCCLDKKESEFSLEHIIPQFLGGAQASEMFKTRDVCIRCNNNLGLFVDASFEKDHMVYSNLILAAHAFYNPDKPTALPFHCMGVSDLTPPSMVENEICEYWIDPLGEQVFWIRPHDEKMYWYSGGNPRSVKTIKSSAYFMFSEKSVKDLKLAFLSFKAAFEGKKVKKILCTNTDIDITLMGFSDPDSLDLERIKFFKKEASKGQKRSGKLQIYLRHDLRFLAKLTSKGSDSIGFWGQYEVGFPTTNQRLVS